MIVDCHVHLVATAPGNGHLSWRMRYSPSFRLLARRLGVGPVCSDPGPLADREMEVKLVATVNEAERLDAAVVLALDAVYRPDGLIDLKRTHLWVTNDYAMDVTARYRRLLFGCSVHPYRPDAVMQFERCVRAGAVLMKWVPIVQDFDPSDERCYPLYEALAHYKVPLLCHTGLEHSLPVLNPRVADPTLLVPALEHGVTVIAAHCGSRQLPVEPDYVPTFMWLAKEYENLYGDTAAFNTGGRAYAYRKVLADPAVRDKLVHGSDWPLPVMPLIRRVGLIEAVRISRDSNWLRRDVRIKQLIGFDAAYWHRAATLLHLPHALLRATDGGRLTASSVRPAMSAAE